MIGVVGLTQQYASNFRITVYNQNNKIYDRSPIKGSLTNAGDYDYYWFTSNSSYVDPTFNWEYAITANIDGTNMTADVDLFVSVVDARYPTSEDYDFKSDNMGADDVYIRSSDDFWTKSGYNKMVGIVFVVGVKAMTPNVKYTLMMTGPTRLEYNYTTLTTKWVQKSFTMKEINAGANTAVYRWYNWGQKDFKIGVDVTDGAVNAYMNFYSEKDFRKNGYLAIPINANNSIWSASGTLNVKIEQRILKDDPALYCYHCWYYLTIVANWTN